MVGATGSLTGYAGGISRKLKLLEHEGVDCSGFFVPAKSTGPVGCATAAGAVWWRRSLFAP